MKEECLKCAREDFLTYYTILEAVINKILSREHIYTTFKQKRIINECMEGMRVEYYELADEIINN